MWVQGEVAGQPDWGELPRGSTLQAFGTGEEGPCVSLDCQSSVLVGTNKPRAVGMAGEGGGETVKEPGSCLAWD